MVSKEVVRESLVRFVREFGRYPTRQETREYDYLYSQNTVNRVLGKQAELGIVEEVYKESPKKCLCCDAAIEFEKRHTNTFCGHSCSAKHSNPTRKKLDTAMFPDADEAIYCLQCTSPLENRRAKFCSSQCSADHRHAGKLDSWISGTSSPTNKVIRKFITEIDGYKCAECGISEWNGKPITLEVEHKDGNSEDSSPGNVCLLCPNCHSQTPTYKGRNKGNGRHYRRIRYQEGKSY